MAAAMNGIALHGGLIPYGGTFLCFSDYCRPAIRLAAMMEIRTIFVMTHDSIGLGEDGPTHQPVEHLSALRAIPHLAVYRPGDAVETAECWEIHPGQPAPRRAAGAVPPADAAAATRARHGEQVRQGRLRAAGSRGRPPQADPDGHRFGAALGRGGADRAAAGGRARPPSCRCPARCIFNQQDAGLSTRRAGRNPRARGGRGGGADELGPVSRLRRPLRRHARVRRVREDRATSTRNSTSRPRRLCAPPGTA